MDTTLRIEAVADELEVGLSACTSTDAGISVTSLPAHWVEDLEHRIVGEPISFWCNPEPMYGADGLPFASNAVLVVHHVAGYQSDEEADKLTAAAIQDATSISGWNTLAQFSNRGVANFPQTKTIGELDSPYGPLLSIVTTGFRVRSGQGYLVQLTVTSPKVHNVVSSTDPESMIAVSVIE